MTIRIELQWARSHGVLIVGQTAVTVVTVSEGHPKVKYSSQVTFNMVPWLQREKNAR